MLSMILTLMGGIGLFLYGMSLLSSSLQQIAGGRLEQTLEKLTNSKLKAFALGTVVTAVIQSSGATTIMLVGFVNAGIMKLIQAIPVMMGANIGTTMTAQLLRLAGGGGAASADAPESDCASDAIASFQPPAALTMNGMPISEATRKNRNMMVSVSSTPFEPA